MKIAQVVPVYVPVPPVGYGGIERVVAGLTDGLLEMGHDVTVFASGDSQVNAKLEPLCAKSVMFSEGQREPLGCHIGAMEKLVRRAHEFDIWHFHFNYVHLPFLRRHPEMRGLTTAHVRLDIPDVRDTIAEYAELPFVSISESQRQPVGEINWLATVPNGLDTKLYHPVLERGEYLAFLGRFSQEKGLHSAFEIAQKSGRKLMVGGCFDDTQKDYTERVVRPILEDPMVEFVGEVGDADKQSLLGGAYALLFPIEWPEPFGLVMIEALACGTPVVAAPLGAVPEVVREGETGYLARTVDEAVRALEKIGGLDRRRCRRDFEQRFSSRAMAQGYLRAYHQLLQTSVVTPLHSDPQPLALGA